VSPVFATSLPWNFGFYLYSVFYSSSGRSGFLKPAGLADENKWAGPVDAAAASVFASLF